MLILSHRSFHVWIFEDQLRELIAQLGGIVPEIQHYLRQNLLFEDSLERSLQVSLSLVHTFNYFFGSLSVRLSAFAHLHTRLTKPAVGAVLELLDRVYYRRDDVFELDADFIRRRYDDELVRIAAFNLFLNSLNLVLCGQMVLVADSVVLLVELTAADHVVQLAFQPSQNQKIVELFEYQRSAETAQVGIWIELKVHNVGLIEPLNVRVGFGCRLGDYQRFIYVVLGIFNKCDAVFYRFAVGFPADLHEPCGLFENGCYRIQHLVFVFELLTACKVGIPHEHGELIAVGYKVVEQVSNDEIQPFAGLELYLFKPFLQSAVHLFIRREDPEPVGKRKLDKSVDNPLRDGIGCDGFVHELYVSGSFELQIVDVFCMLRPNRRVQKPEHVQRQFLFRLFLLASEDVPELHFMRPPASL